MSRASRACGGVCLAFVAGACRGDISDKPPVHLVQNMDQQQRFDPQEPNAFYSDGRAARLPVAGTVAVGQLKNDDHLYRGRGLDGELADELPAGIELGRELLERGQTRYNIYCAPCHDASGSGKGVVVARGVMPPPSLHAETMRTKELGYFFEVMTNGIRNMSSYAAQVPVRDRWAIAAYIRALQLSRSATIEQVPKDVASGKNWGEAK